LEFNSLNDHDRVLIIVVTVYAIWRGRPMGPSKRPSEPKIGLRWIALGLLAVCLFYFADLASMYVLPVVTSTEEAMESMNILHCDFSWLVVLFAMIAISSGFIELRRTQIELTEKNELLADLSSKLAKFLPPQLYNSIFTGTHTTRVAARRAKLTIFFLDIADFTETADSLESEEAPLRDMGYSLQANSKTREGDQHIDRDAQFRYINTQAMAFLAANEPVFSVDTKKKELVGNFRNNGREGVVREGPNSSTFTTSSIPS